MIMSVRLPVTNVPFLFLFFYCRRVIVTGVSATTPTVSIHGCTLMQGVETYIIISDHGYRCTLMQGVENYISF